MCPKDESDRQYPENTIRPTEDILVLHVDDEPQLADMVGSYLEQIDDDLSIIAESDARSGLAQLDDNAIDCIISDYQMPGMDGIEFLQAVRSEYPNLPFILFTGEGSEDVASKAINAGVTSYLQKNGTDTYELLAQQVQNAVGHHRSQRLAKITQDRLFDLYEQADGFYVLDEDWRITYWNQQVADRTGRAPEEVLGQIYWDVFPEATEIATEDCFRTAMDTGDPQRFEVWYDPGEYWADVRVYPLDDGLFVHSRDISEIKEREQELERRNHILESFANTVSHDLRNPLSVAEGQLQ